MDNLYILTSLISAITAFSFLYIRGKLELSSKMGVFLASSLGVICLSPFLLKIDYSNFSILFCFYILLAGIFRFLSLVIMLEVVRKTSVERYSAVNPINIFMSFLIFSVIDYENTINLIQQPLKFIGIVGSIIGIVSVLVMSKKDKKFMETFKIFL